MACSKEALSIHFRLPEDFAGMFVVIDSPKGKTIAKAGNTYILEIPRTRTLLVNNAAFMYKWHLLSAEYPTGKRLVSGGLNDPPDDQVKLFEVTATSDNDMFYFVGTTREIGSIRGSSGTELRVLLEHQQAGTKLAGKNATI